MSGGDNDKRKINSLFDKSTSGSEQSGSESDEEGRKPMWVGGSSKSGQEVLGPPNADSGNHLSRFFSEAYKHGGKFVSLNSKEMAKQSFKPFSGAGQSLAGTSSQAEPSSDNPGVQQRTVRLEMWSDVFTVDGGPPRSYTSPENQAFLELIMKGLVPKELQNPGTKEEIVLQIENRSSMKYKAQQRPAKTAAFTGKGYLLGGPLPSVVGAGKVGEKYKPKGTEEQQQKPEPIALPKECEVDANRPTTNIQVRLPDGSRIVLRVNLHHTIGNIRLMICSKLPHLASTTFAMLAGFPAQKLEFEDMTVEQANLASSSVLIHIGE